MNKLILVLPALVLAGCSSTKFEREQDELYQVSMAQYQDYNCSQLSAEMRRVSHLVDQQEVHLRQQQPRENSNEYLDAAVSALAISMGQYQSTQRLDREDRLVLSRLKSQYNGLDQLFIRKNCVSKSM